MAQVVDTWRPGASLSGPTESSAQPLECAGDRLVAEAVIAFGAKEGVGGHGSVLISPGRVATQRLQGAWVQGHQSCPAILSGPHGEHAAEQVDVFTRERQGFGDP